MSSEDVRVAINLAVAEAAAPTAVYDLSDYVTLDDALGEIDSEAVLVQYIASDEQAVTIGGYQNQGWEETGNVVLHYMVPGGFNSASAVQKCDTMRKYLRRRRLTSSVVIEACTPFSDSGGGMYSGNSHAWISNLYYERRDCG